MNFLKDTYSSKRFVRNIPKSQKRSQRKSNLESNNENEGTMNIIIKTIIEMIFLVIIDYNDYNIEKNIQINY